MSDVRPAPLVRRWPSPGPWLDSAVVAALFVADLTGQALATAGHDVPSTELGAGPIILAAASAAALWWRRPRPLLVFAVIVALVATAGAAFDEGLLTHRSGAVVVLAMYAVGSWSEHRRWSVAVCAVALALAVAGALGDHAGVVESLTAGLAAIALPWVLGLAARTQRCYIAEVEQRLDAAVRERDEQARRAVADERAHIARELHDVVAHHVSLIGVQAGAARTALDRYPKTTRTALGEIEAASRDALGEMRRLLDTLRDSSPAALTPHPGLADVGRLAARIRRRWCGGHHARQRRCRQVAARPRAVLLPHRRGSADQRHSPLGGVASHGRRRAGDDRRTPCRRRPRTEPARIRLRRARPARHVGAGRLVRRHAGGRSAARRRLRRRRRATSRRER